MEEKLLKQIAHLFDEHGETNIVVIRTKKTVTNIYGQKNLNPPVKVTFMEE